MWDLIRSNERKSLLLMMGLGAFTVLVGAILGAAADPEQGLVTGAFLALSTWLVLTIITYFAADSAVLSMSGAREVSHKEFPQLWNVVEELCIASGLPRPRIYVIEDTAPNAFAVGRTPQTAAVAITSGLLQKLTRDELAGVMAHELAHIRNRDTNYLIRAAVMVGTIALLCDFFLRYARLFRFGGGKRSGGSKGGGGGGAQLVLLVLALLLAILAPIIARMLYLCISRRREYLADASAVEFTRNPEGLASALEKISADQEVLEVANRATAPLFIVNPIKAHEERAKELFSTHPPLKERVGILRSLGTGATLNDYERQFRLMAKDGKRGLYSAKDLQQASSERGTRPVPKGQAEAALQPGQAPFGLEHLKGGGARTPEAMQQRLEPLARVLTAGAVAQGQLPPEAVLAALFAPGGLGMAGALMMSCACGERLALPDRPKLVVCAKCGAQTPVAAETLEQIARAKQQAQAAPQAAGAAAPLASSTLPGAGGKLRPVPAPVGSGGVPVPPPPKPVAAGASYGVRDADGDGKLDSVKFEERQSGAARWEMFKELEVDNSRGGKVLRGSDLDPSARPPVPPPPAPGARRGSDGVPPPPPAAAKGGQPPDDPGSDEARRALIPDAFSCACGYTREVPANFKGSRLKCPKCGAQQVYYLVNGK